MIIILFDINYIYSYYDFFIKGNSRLLLDLCGAIDGVCEES
jgi:hypothetical protein